VFEPVPVIDKDLFEDVPALSRFDNHQVAPSEGGWDMLRVQPVYHVSPAPSNPLIGLHPGMLTHIPSPGITGTSGQPKNENSYTIKTIIRPSNCRISTETSCRDIGGGTVPPNYQAVLIQ